MIENGEPEQGPLILLAENSEDDAHLAIRALRDHSPAEVVVTRTSSEATDFLFCQGPYAERDPLRTPHLLLLDCYLPPESGLAVLRRVRADDRTRLLPVVMISSAQSESDVKEYYEAGANSFVPKPVKADAFKEMMQRTCGFWLNCNVPPVTL